MLRSKRDLRVYLRARVLERLGVGVDADDRRRRARQHGRAVALAAREVDDAAAVRRASRDPLVDDEVAAEPVVLLRHVGQRALAGQVQRRDAGRLVALDVELVGHAFARMRTETHVRKGRQPSATSASGRP